MTSVERHLIFGSGAAIWANYFIINCINISPTLTRAFARSCVPAHNNSGHYFFPSYVTNASAEDIWHSGELDVEEWCSLLVWTLINRAKMSFMIV